MLRNQKTEGPLKWMSRLEALIQPLILVVLLPGLALWGCSSRSVGGSGTDGSPAGDDGTVVVDPDGGPGYPDAGPGTPVQDVVGWGGTAFEHAGFVQEGDVDPDTLASCDPYIFAVEGAETWWVVGDPLPGLRFASPWAGEIERMGLVRLSGFVTQPGTFGHDGRYQRQLLVTSSELLVCPSVAATGHCLLPRTDDLCTLPAIPYYDSVEHYAIESYPGPGGMSLSYTAVAAYDPNVADGATNVVVGFVLPGVGTEDPSTWEQFNLDEVSELTMQVQKLGFIYEEIPFTPLPGGYIWRNWEQGGIRLSIDGIAPNDSVRRLWGDFPIMYMDGEQ